MTVQELLDLRDRLVNRSHPNEDLELDFSRLRLYPYDSIPKHWQGVISQPLSIQQAVSRSPAMAGELI